MTPQSNDPQAALNAANDALRAIVIGEATGDAAIGEFFLTFAEQISAGLRDFEQTGEWYAWRYDTMNREKARRGRETADMPSGNSLASQLTKARTVTQMGTYDAKRAGTIGLVRDFATQAKVAWKYAPLIVACGAVATTLDATPDASDDALRDAMHEAVDNMPVKVKTTSGELAKLAKAFDKLRADAVHGAVINRACASPDTDADVAKLAEELFLLCNAVVALEAKAGGKRRA